MVKIINKTKKPIENQKTAAWADVRSRKRVSGVPEPSDFMVEFAKEYVDENEK